MNRVQPRRLSEYGAPSVITEAELVASYLAPTLEARPCACGSVCIADRREPTTGVQLHQESREHVGWRKRSWL